MGTRERYEPGTFSWIELATTEPEAAKGFYAELFGWTAEDTEIPAGGVYTMAQIGSSNVAGMMSQPQQQREGGAPPNWFSYVTVASADDAAARAGEVGGTVHAEPFDVMEAGRMAVLADPTGAMFGVWEARDHIGAGLVNDPGSLTWNELATNDPATAIEFYSALFGWRIEPIDTGGGPPYWSIGHHGGTAGRNGGMRELTPEEEGIPPHWMPYFTVESVDGTIERAAGAGGAAMFGPLDLSTGRIAIVRDPQGAFFGVFEGEVDD